MKKKETRITTHCYRFSPYRARTAATTPRIVSEPTRTTLAAAVGVARVVGAVVVGAAVVGLKTAVLVMRTGADWLDEVLTTRVVLAGRVVLDLMVLE